MADLGERVVLEEDPHVGAGRAADRPERRVNAECVTLGRESRPFQLLRQQIVRVPLLEVHLRVCVDIAGHGDQQVREGIYVSARPRLEFLCGCGGGHRDDVTQMQIVWLSARHSTRRLDVRATFTPSNHRSNGCSNTHSASRALRVLMLG
ncbi:unannotated protein [freshwater metagenome]|uniref:Unannotated protein n=1 Tax=freshwater metagenome TaxID=449393 RepID=A0A6J7UIY6_9ZZZZ